MLLDTSKISIDHLQDKLFSEKQIQLSVLRLDKIHPVISGNKLFKLHYFLEKAIYTSHKTLLTLGGAYSNHLVATAYACKLAGVRSIAIVRGERSKNLSHTLNTCLEYGMELRFVTRELFAFYLKNGVPDDLKKTFGECEIVPEGGYHPLGANGAALIMEMLKETYPSHICSAIGTATTIGGILSASGKDQKMIGVSVLKGMTDIERRLSYVTENKADLKRIEILYDYHFGGYAKKNPELISFMNQFYEKHKLPTDFVYTGKMMYGIIDQIKKNRFPKGSTIVCLHTGGLQGNGSLLPGTLNF
jgi:1-aminocyclopropane-1-carboxylate deaminase